MLILLGEQWRTFTNLCCFSSRWSSVSFGANLCPVVSLSCICRSRQWGEDRWDPWSWRMEKPSKTTLIILLQYDLMRAPPLVSYLLRLRSSHRSQGGLTSALCTLSTFECKASPSLSWTIAFCSSHCFAPASDLIILHGFVNVSDFTGKMSWLNTKLVRPY